MSTTTSTKDQKCLTIAIVGLPSTGKSSLINALIGLFLRSASKNRDTFVPTKFQMRKAKLGTLKEALEIAKNTGKVKNLDKQKFDELKQIKEKMSSKQKDELLEYFTKINEENCGKYILSDFDYDIIDFPGFGDPTGVIDGKDFFLEGVLQNMIQCDLIVYVVDSNSPFLTNEQMVSFEKIIARRDENLETHYHYSEVFIAATKYDDDDEEVQEMWKDMHTTLKMPKENIFFVSNYQMFFENMQQFIYLPSEYKQEFINIYKHIYGRKGKMPDYSKFLNSTITKKQFIGSNPLPAEIKTKCEFIERLKTISNADSLKERRAKPKYDLLMKILNDKILVNYFKILSGKELMKLFISVSRYKNKLPEDLELYHITREFEVRLEYYDEYIINGSKKNLHFSTKEERHQAAAILSNIVLLSKKQSNIPISYYHNIIKENLLQVFHKACYSSLYKTISVLMGTKYYSSFIQELSKYKHNKCYITRQFIWYLFEMLGKPLLVFHSIKAYIAKGVEKLDAETLLMIDAEIRKNTKTSSEIKKLFTKEVCVSLMAHLIREKKEYLFSFDGFVFDDEFELFKMFTKISFADLAIFKETDNNKFEDMKSLMNEKYLPSLNYYCSKHDTNFIFPKILYPLKKTAEILKLEKFLDS